MAEKTSANIGFEKQIWDAACVLWGHIPAAEYRKVIIGLIFLRYISVAFDAQYKKLVTDGDGFENDPDAYLMDNTFSLCRRKHAGRQLLQQHIHRRSARLLIQRCVLSKMITRA